MIAAETPWRPCRPLANSEWQQLRRAAVFTCHKWDHQVEDVATIARGPLVLTRAAWATLTHDAEALARETLALETALLNHPALWRELGLSRSLRRALAQTRPSSAVRVMRFDFHWTTSGWQVSEVNADVPGGFNESAIAGLMLPHHPECRSVGDPGRALVSAIAAQIPAGATVALVHATAYSDDRQVMEFLADACAQAGLGARPCAPDHLHWTPDGCQVAGQAIAAVIRFFPGEWLPALPRNCGWENLAGHPAVLLANPLSAVLVQSKRLPLVWSRLSTPCPTWQRLLPETDAPHRRTISSDAEWILKPVFGRVGDGIAMAGVSSDKIMRASARSAWWFPGSWIAQRRFTSVAWDGPDGPCHPCIGVYTVDGQVAGAYGRYASVPLIDHRAVDVPILVEAA